MSTAQRRPHAGTRRKLVVAFDVGTTFSGASYAILEPGQPPEIRGVTQFPGQQQMERSWLLVPKRIQTQTRTLLNVTIYPKQNGTYHVVPVLQSAEF
ncbi:hypothetical protein APHAL10511_005114 [Amanita phalloides]|nr:hypothetical protein APHAL10511_005114 [Amanita phalloides]